MYIGAWTEYRLAQEQAQTSRRQNAAQQPDESSGRTRKGAGIYHPSLSDKGGMEVAGLPDRESFRRTLESALSSNLAADDAENISQALEPLMQRLPSIHPAVPASGRTPGGRTPLSTKGRSAQLPRRQQKRKPLNRRRCGGGGPSRYIYTRSDAGTRPAAAEPTSGGTRSTRSGFSAASAPLDTTAGPEDHRARSSRIHGDSRSGGFGFGGQPRQGRPGGRSRTSHLPLIIDARRRRRNTHHGSDTTCSGDTHRITSNTLKLSRGASPSIEPSEACEGGDQDYSSCGTNNRPFTTAPVHATDGVGHYEDEVAAERGGVDGGAAATILRMARRRDTVGLKADFEQFWTWKRKAPTPTVPNRKKGTPPATKRNAPNKRKVGGGGRSEAAASKLEALERMKMVYMAKEIGDGGGIPADTRADSPGERKSTTIPLAKPRLSDNAARAPYCEVAQTTPSPPEFSGDTNLNLSRNTAGQTQSVVQQNREGSGGGSGSDKPIAKPGAHGGGFSFDEFQGGGAVAVPDLELTENRIRQVEKYFGGSGGAGGSVGLWRRRPPEDGNTSQLLAGEPAGSLGLESPSDRAPAGNVAEDHVGTSLMRSDIINGCGDGGDGGRRSTRNFGDCGRNREKDASIVDGVVGPGTPRRGQDLEASGSSQPAPAGGRAGAGAAGAVVTKAARIAGRREEPDSTAGDLGGSGQQGGVFFQNSTSWGTAVEMQIPPEGKSPFSSSVGAEQAPSPNKSVAPAWCCGDNSSLEDLVCWTKGLDYDAAVKGLEHSLTPSLHRF